MHCVVFAVGWYGCFWQRPGPWRCAVWGISQGGDRRSWRQRKRGTERRRRAVRCASGRRPPPCTPLLACGRSERARRTHSPTHSRRPWVRCAGRERGRRRRQRRRLRALPGRGGGTPNPPFPPSPTKPCAVVVGGSCRRARGCHSGLSPLPQARLIALKESSAQRESELYGARPTLQSILISFVALKRRSQYSGPPLGPAPPTPHRPCLGCNAHCRASARAAIPGEVPALTDSKRHEQHSTERLCYIDSGRCYISTCTTLTLIQTAWED